MFDSWLDFSAFMPHGFCMKWDPALLGTMIFANVLIAIAYFSIPAALWLFVRKRRDLAFPWMFQLFGVFIVSCGTTHLIKVFTIYKAAYWLEAIVDLFTGLVSIATAILLWQLIPKALSLPSPKDMVESNKKLVDSMKEAGKLNTELQSLNEQFRIARDQAIESSNLKSGFVATISHELRTPLTGIIGLNELLIQSNLDKEQEQIAVSIQEAAESLLAIVNDILDLSKLEAGRLKVEMAPLSVRQLTNECLDIVSSAASRKNLTLKSSIDPQLDMPLFGDGIRIKQILTNLLGNAVKFTDSGEVELRARFLSHEKEHLHLCFVVRDTGIGIADEELTRIFLPFTQADQTSARRYGGTGLGLSICKYLAELVGAKLSVSSTLGEGSSFTLDLMLQKNAGADDLTKLPPEPTERLVSRVLAVEDDPFLQQLASKQLAKLGADAIVARNADEALEQLKRQKFDVILMDCHMPGTDGFALTAILRNSDEWQEIPIVAMTAGAMIGDFERCMAAGMDDYLSKPYTLKQLEAMLRKWTGKRAKSAEPTVPKHSMIDSGGYGHVELSRSRKEKLAGQSASDPGANTGTDAEAGSAERSPAELATGNRVEEGGSVADTGALAASEGAAGESPATASAPDATDHPQAGNGDDIDLERLRGAYGEDGANEILHTFLRTTNALMADFEKARQSHESELIKQYSHRLKGASSMAFMSSLYQASAKLERNAKEADWDEIEKGIDEVKRLVTRIENRCDHEFGKN